MVYIKKHSGEQESFDPRKVEYALIRAGASEDVAAQVAQEVGYRIKNGTSTEKVYRMAFNLLKKEDTTSATRFGLKTALMRLGPSGFPFEKYMARILDEHHYITKTNQILDGACVRHEVDIVAEKDREKYMVECKYHNQPGYSTGLKEAMYTYARFLDLTEAGHDFTKAWIVTNTKITSEAVKYCMCKGMLATSWGHPERQSLQDLIESECMYPVTILSMVTEDIKDRLADYNIMLAKDLINMDDDEVRNVTRLSKKQIRPLLEEIHGLANTPYCR